MVNAMVLVEHGGHAVETEAIKPGPQMLLAA